MDTPITFEFDYQPGEMSVEKEAKIFEAGEYPDKGIAITEADLDSIVANFEEVPVKVEHTDSALDPLGTVKRVWRRGKELFATLAFPRDLATFLERRSVKRLSVGLLKAPLRLAEVSLVLSPRVVSAAMFGQRPALRRIRQAHHRQAQDRAVSSQPPGGIGEVLSNPESDIRNSQVGEEVECGVSETKHANAEAPSGADKRDAEIAELKFALRARDVEARLAALKAQGRIVPASEPFAREILIQGDQVIAFSGGQATAAELFVRFLEAQPKVITFSELAPAGSAAPSPLSAEEEELLAKLGVTREQMEKYAG